MIFFVVFNPDCFSPQHAQIVHYLADVKAFLALNIKQTIFLVDNEGELLGILKTHLIDFPDTGGGYRVKEILIEYMKPGSSKFLPAFKTKAKWGDTLHNIIRACETLQADGFMIAPTQVPVLNSWPIDCARKAICLSNYMNCKFEEARARTLERIQPHELSDTIFIRHISRITMYALRLTFFDKFIGSSGSGVEKWFKGIEWVIKIWQQTVLQHVSHYEVSIVTCADPNRNDVKDVHDRIQKELIEKLRISFPSLSVVLRLKLSKAGEWHARYLQVGGYCSVRFEKGFDIGPGKGLKGHELQIEHKLPGDYLDRYLALPEFIHPGSE